MTVTAAISLGTADKCDANGTQSYKITPEGVSNV